MSPGVRVGWYDLEISGAWGYASFLILGGPRASNVSFTSGGRLSMPWTTRPLKVWLTRQTPESSVFSSCALESGTTEVSNAPAGVTSMVSSITSQSGSLRTV